MANGYQTFADALAAAKTRAKAEGIEQTISYTRSRKTPYAITGRYGVRPFLMVLPNGDIKPTR